MTLRRRTLLLLLLATGVLTLAGCSAGPTAPMLPAATTSGLPGSDVRRTGALDDTTVVQRGVSSAGATLNAGRFTLTVPPGAVSGPVTFTLTQTDPAGTQVTLSTTPSMAILAVPFTLAADCSGLFNPGRMRHTYVSQWDPTNQRWQRLPDSHMDLATARVTATSTVCANFRIENNQVQKGK